MSDWSRFWEQTILSLDFDLATPSCMTVNTLLNVLKPQCITSALKANTCLMGLL